MRRHCAKSLGTPGRGCPKTLSAKENFSERRPDQNVDQLLPELCSQSDREGLRHAEGPLVVKDEEVVAHLPL